VVDAGLGSLPERVTTEMTVNTTPAMMAETGNERFAVMTGIPCTY
jgi:hypothetical protein